MEHIVESSAEAGNPMVGDCDSLKRDLFNEVTKIARDIWGEIPHWETVKVEAALAKVSILVKTWERKYLKEIADNAFRSHVDPAKSASDLKDSEKFAYELLEELGSMARMSIKHLSQIDVDGLMVVGKERDIKEFYVFECLSLEFYKKFHSRIKQTLQRHHPKIWSELHAKLSPFPSYPEDVLDHRGVVTDHLGNKHQLVSGAKAARMIAEGLTPELPFGEVYLMHSELDRLGIFKNTPMSFGRFGGRYCVGHGSNHGCQYVVYNQDSAEVKFRTLQFWSWRDVMPRSKQLDGWGDSLQDAIIPLDARGSAQLTGMRNLYPVTFKTSVVCRADIQLLNSVINDSELTRILKENFTELKEVREYFGPVDSVVSASLCAVDGHFMDLQVTLMRYSFSQEDARVQALSTFDQEVLSRAATFPEIFAIDLSNGKWASSQIAVLDQDQIELSDVEGALIDSPRQRAA